MNPTTMRTTTTKQSAYHELMFWSKILQYFNDSIISDQTETHIHWLETLVMNVVEFYFLFIF